MRYWKEEEVIQIRSTREEEVLKEVEEEDEGEGEEEGKGSGRRHAKLVRQSRVKESMSPRSIRCLSQHLQSPVHFLLRKHVKQLNLQKRSGRLICLRIIFLKEEGHTCHDVTVFCFKERQASPYSPNLIRFIWSQ